MGWLLLRFSGRDEKLPGFILQQCNYPGWQIGENITTVGLVKRFSTTQMNVDTQDTIIVHGKTGRKYNTSFTMSYHLEHPIDHMKA